MFVALHSPRGPAEQAILESLLEAEGIGYFIQNDVFGSLEVGPRIPLFNAKTIMVEDIDEERARELLADYLGLSKGEEQALPGAASVRERIRMVIEFLLFGWIMPGRRSKKKTGNDAGD